MSTKIKILISAFLLFHLLGVVTSPNQSSFLTQSLLEIYRPYMTTLGLFHSWGFFAPEPVSPPIYIDYLLERKNGTTESKRFPNEVSPYFFRDRQNRRLTLSKFILTSDDSVKSTLVRYLCNTEKDVSSVKIWRVMYQQPSLESVKSGKIKMTDSDKFHIHPFGTYYCPDKNGDPI
ncbi:MAG: hypothetical protein M9962_01940 [Oligoflexia bacterium]|nr:hypothetical protein [Oligoflexia bacterium]